MRKVAIVVLFTIISTGAGAQHFPDPCEDMRPVTEKEVSRLQPKWIKVRRLGCVDRKLPPRGSRVVIYCPKSKEQYKIVSRKTNNPLEFEYVCANETPATHWLLLKEPAPGPPE